MQQAKFYVDSFSALDRESSSASIHRSRLAYLFDWQPQQEEEERKGRGGMESNARISGFDGSVHLCVPFFAGGGECKNATVCGLRASRGGPSSVRDLTSNADRVGQTFLVRFLLR